MRIEVKKALSKEGNFDVQPQNLPNTSLKSLSFNYVRTIKLFVIKYLHSLPRSDKKLLRLNFV